MIQNLTLLDINMPQADSFEVFGVNEEDVQLDMMKLRLASISLIEKEDNHGIYMLPKVFNLPEGKEMAGRE